MKTKQTFNPLSNNFDKTIDPNELNINLENKVDKVEGKGLSDENLTLENKQVIDNFRIENNRIYLSKNGVDIAYFSEEGTWVTEKLTTGVASFHLGEIHSVGSALKGIIFKNKLNNEITIPSRTTIKSNGDNPTPSMNIEWGDIEVVETQGPASTGTAPYILEFQNPNSLAVFEVSSIAKENYTGQVTYKIIDKITGVVAYQFKKNVNLVDGQEFNMPVEYPMFNDENRLLEITLKKENGDLVNVADTSSGNAYAKIKFRNYQLVVLATVHQLNGKVDKVPGKGLSDENFTLALKEKLVSLEPSRNKGLFATLALLESTFPTAEEGAFAFVDGGVGEPNKLYTYDNGWKIVMGENSIMSPTEVKTNYESNPDTNAFTDLEKLKLSGIEPGANVNIQANWTQTNNTEDNFIKNKPTSLSDFVNDLTLTENQITNLDKYTKNEVNTLLSEKQENLISGDNIKTINNKVILGSGNVDITKSDVGLGNVDNTSDLNKPISSATQTALNAKANDNQVVKLTGNQTINGIKTFNSPVVGVNPTVNNHLVTKSYVDAELMKKADGNTGVIQFNGDFGQRAVGTITDFSGDVTFTTMMWVKSTANTNGKGLWSIGKSNQSGQCISGYSNSGNNVGIDIWGTSTYIADTSYIIGQWIHVAWTKSPGNGIDKYEIYVNGIKRTLTATREGLGGLNITGDELHLGGIALANGGNNYNFPGLVDNFSVWNRVLTAEEIRSYMYRKPTGVEAGLLRFFDCNEPTGTILIDKTGSGNNLSIASGGTRIFNDNPY